MEDLVSRMHSTVSDIAVRTQVCATVDSLVHAVERAEDASKRELLHTALRVARRKLEQLSATAERERAARAEDARRAAALRQVFTGELSRVATELREKVGLQAELESTKGTLLASEAAASELRQQLAHAREAAAERERAHTALVQHLQRDMNGDYFMCKLSNGLLLTMFQFMEARDVLALASTNQAMYRRVDAVFGQEAFQGAARRVLQDSGGGGGVAGGTGGGAGGGAGADAVGAMMASTSPRWGGRPRDGHALRQHVSPKQQRGGAGHRRHSSFGGLRRSPNKAYPRDGETMSSLRRKLAQCQEQLATTTAVAEDARAKLGTLTQVKEFLVEKLKESEVAIRQAHEARDAVKEQANSDREVMAFLDEHTRELEGRVAALTEERDKLKTALEESASSAQSKRKILEDMLRVSDAKREDTAVQFKAQKRLLVKEIKTLRASVATLQRERNRAVTHASKLAEALSRLKGTPTPGKA